MKQIMSKKLLAVSVATALSLTATSTSADTITQIILEDIDGDTAVSGFRFTSAATAYAAADNSFPGGFDVGDNNAFGATADDCGGGPGSCGPLLFNTGEIGTNVFSSGFNFGGGGDFQPVIVGSTFDGSDYVADGSGNTGGSVIIDEAGTLTLDLTALDFGGFYNAPTFFLAPQNRADFKAIAGVTPVAGDELLPVLGDPAFTGTSSTDLPYYIDTLVDNGDGTYGFIIRWTAKIQQASTFDGNTSRWRLEGTIAVADAAPSVFIAGASGVAGDFTSPVLPNVDPYVDAGAVCQDVVDGTIAPLTTVASLPGTLAAGTFLSTTDLVGTSTGAAGSSFTVTYTCTDSQNNTTTAVRTVTVGVDDTPPDITLGAGAVEPGRTDSVDGATVNILVGQNYVDAGATCLDSFDGPIPISVTPDPAVVDTSIASTGTIIEFSCNDAAMNGPTVVQRTVNVLEDTTKPVITLQNPGPFTVSLDGDFIVPQLSPAVECNDTNPVDAGVNLINNNIDVSQSTVDTSVVGQTNIVYNCSDAAGNAADPVTLEVNVVAGQNFQILSMTIEDVNADRIAGCFKFNILEFTCNLANRFAGDSSTIDSFGTFGVPKQDSNATLPGIATDLDVNGVPVGIKFGEYQGLGAFTPGWNFTGSSFVPFTFNPPSEQADPPTGLLIVAGNTNLLDLQSFPFSGRFSAGVPNDFFLDPDAGTLEIDELTDNNDDDGVTRTFNYRIRWTHVITLAEDPITKKYVGNIAKIILEGVMTVGSTPVIVNGQPKITGLTVAQDDRSITRTVTQSGGIITATVVATDPDTEDTLSFDWSTNPVTAVGPTNEATFSFEASSLTTGTTALSVTVSDDNVDDSKSAVSTLALQVLADAPALSDGEDSNGNGTGDATEGFGDTDDDGIPDYRDRSIDPTRNSRSFDAPDEGEVVISAGRLRMGDASFTTGRDSFIVTETDVGVFDPLNRVEGLKHSGGGIVDFEIVDLPLGGAVSIVVPQTVALPNVPIYRKFTEGKGWFTFSATSGNALASAKKVNGVCPEPTSSAYGIALVEGDDCLRITIVDGSAMDGDALVNGIVIDPGTIASNGPVPVGKAKGTFDGGGCSLSSTPVASRDRFDWAIVAFFIALLGYRAHRRKEQTLK